MAKITNEEIIKINDPEEVLSFLSHNMWKEENNDVLEDAEIRQYIKNVMNIIQFETDYFMEGLWTTYQNYNNNFEYYIKSFEDSGNNEIAYYIKEINRLYNLNKSKIENDEKFEQESMLDELENGLRKIIEDAEYWRTVEKYIALNNNAPR